LRATKNFHFRIGRTRVVMLA